MGSLGMFVGGWILALVVLWVYLLQGIFPGSLISYFPVISLIALAGTLVESLPLKDIDNITVTLTAVILGQILI